MRKLLIINIILTLLLFSCNGKKSNAEIYDADPMSKDLAGNNEYSDALKTEKEIALFTDTLSFIRNDEKSGSLPVQTTQFYVKDSTQYSATFLADFKARHSCYETVALIDDTIIINNIRGDFVIIPTDLPYDSVIRYEEMKNEINYTMTVKRINISTIEYVYFERVNGNNVNIKQGYADLDPAFYFGAEGVFVDDNGVEFGMNEYISVSEGGCQTLIYIGVESIQKSFLVQPCNAEPHRFSSPIMRLQEP